MNVTSFSFNQCPVRVVMRKGRPWFIAEDVCNALGYTNSKAAMDCLDDDEKDVASNGTLGSNHSIINESGLQALALLSYKPGARRFLKWVHSEIISASREISTRDVKPIDPSAIFEDTRWLMVIRDGRCTLNQIPADAAIMSPEEIPKMVSDPNELEHMLVFEILRACTGRIASREQSV